MQKVEGSSPFSRFKSPANRCFFETRGGLTGCRRSWVRVLRHLEIPANPHILVPTAVPATQKVQGSSGVAILAESPCKYAVSSHSCFPNRARPEASRCAGCRLVAKTARPQGEKATKGKLDAVHAARDHPAFARAVPDPPGQRRGRGDLRVDWPAGPAGRSPRRGPCARRRTSLEQPPNAPAALCPQRRVEGDVIWCR